MNAIKLSLLIVMFFIMFLNLTAVASAQGVCGQSLETDYSFNGFIIYPSNLGSCATPVTVPLSATQIYTQSYGPTGDTGRMVLLFQTAQPTLSQIASTPSATGSFTLYSKYSPEDGVGWYIAREPSEWICTYDSTSPSASCINILLPPPSLTVDGSSTGPVTISPGTVLTFNAIGMSGDSFTIDLLTTPTPTGSGSSAFTCCSGVFGSIPSTFTYTWPTLPKGSSVVYYAEVEDTSVGMYSNPVILRENALAAGTNAACSTYNSVYTSIFILGIILLLLAGALYGGSHVMPGSSKGTVQGYAMGLLLGGIIGIVIALLAPYILGLISPSAGGAQGQCNSTVANATSNLQATAQICNVYYGSYSVIYILGIILMILAGALYGGSQLMPGSSKGTIQGYAMAIFLGGIIVLIIASIAPYLVTLIGGSNGVSSCSTTVTAPSGTSATVNAICSAYYNIENVILILGLMLIILGGVAFGASQFVPGQTRGTVQAYGVGLILGGIIAVIISVLAPYILNTISPGASAGTSGCSGATGPLPPNSTVPVLNAVCNAYNGVYTAIFVLGIVLVLLGGALYGGSHVMPGSSKGTAQAYGMGLVIGGVIAIVISAIAPALLTAVGASNTISTCPSPTQLTTAPGQANAVICNAYFDVQSVILILGIVLIVLGGALYGSGQIMPGSSRGTVQGYAMGLLFGGIIALIASALAPYIFQLINNNNAVAMGCYGAGAVSINPGVNNAVLAVCNVYNAVNGGILILGLMLMILGGALYGGSHVMPGSSKGTVQGYAMGMFIGGIIAVILSMLAPYVAQVITGSQSIPSACSTPVGQYTSNVGTPVGQAEAAVCNVYNAVSTVVFILALTVMLLGGALYAGSQVLPGSSRGTVQGYAMSMILAGVVGSIIALAAPWLIGIATNQSMTSVIQTCQNIGLACSGGTCTPPV